MGNKHSRVGNYEVFQGNILGRGRYGDVYKGKHLQKHQEVALKKCVTYRKEEIAIAMKEIKMFEKIPIHKHVVQLLDYIISQNNVWIVMEFCDVGHLVEYFKKYNPNLQRQVEVMYECACAVHHMHSQEPPIVHRDMKPYNILFKTDKSVPVVKIADFGLTKAMKETSAPTSTSPFAKLKTKAGTEAFMAPELFYGASYDQSVDTFALGLVYLAMINFKMSDEDMIPRTTTSISNREDVTVGHEMLQARLGDRKEPVVVMTVATDCEKLKAIKTLISDMVKNNAKDRIPMKEVVSKLRDIQEGLVNAQRMVGRPSSGRPLMRSNVQLAVQSKRGERSPQDEPISEECEDSYIQEDTDEDSSDSSDEEHSDTPDIGYLLMRGAMEDKLRRQREDEIKQKQEREKAEKVMELLPLLALMKLMESGDGKFDVGDRVIVDKDMEKAKGLQQGHGGWSSGMEKYLDAVGTVKEKKERMLVVQFTDGQVLHFNPLLLSKVEPEVTGKKLVAGKFKVSDVVQIKVDVSTLKELQQEHGGWNDKMREVMKSRGVVLRVLPNGDVFVKFISAKWRIHPDALQTVDTSAEEIEAGDLVIVLDNKDEVIRLQKGYGEWNDKMAECLGKTGVVQRVGANRKAVVEIDDTTWVWNKACIKVIAKGEEIMLAMLKDVFT